MKRLLFLATVLAVLLAACGPQATPTIDPVQVQASAIAAANTMVAMTQAAIPTATNTPLPTDTPVPSPTPIPLPTLSVEDTPTLAPISNSSSGNPCQGLLDVSQAGPTFPLVIKNDTRGPATVTIGLSTKNKFGQCGYLSWSNIAKGSSISTHVPQTIGGGCYWAYAWINDPKQQRSISGGGYCWNNDDKVVLEVTYDGFLFHQ
ncbi:MAG TPA: hypothetical protein VHM28_08050 [Anaerolineales bacterium]|jgi:hypothetical protein|nr:hypothetical protein [Anaerolineales bacterium]